MAIYEYQAIAQSGKTIKGVIDAETAAVARRKLREQKLHPTQIAESSGAEQLARGAKRAGFGRVSVRDVALMTRQFAVLLQAGMPLVEALTALLDQTSRVRLSKAIYDVRDKINAGSTLADALATHPRIFSQLYVNMVGAGEASGTLESVLFRLAEVQERQAKLRARLLSTLAYPMFMALFALCVITFLMLMIVPRITQIFEKQGQELPGVTKVLINTSDFIGAYWWAMVLGLDRAALRADGLGPVQAEGSRLRGPLPQDARGAILAHLGHDAPERPDHVGRPGRSQDSGREPAYRRAVE